MPWTFEVHKCKLPEDEEVEKYAQYSVWSCPDCGSEWMKLYRDGTTMVRQSYHSLDRVNPPGFKWGQARPAFGDDIEWEEDPPVGSIGAVHQAIKEIDESRANERVDTGGE